MYQVIWESGTSNSSFSVEDRGKWEWNVFVSFKNSVFVNAPAVVQIHLRIF